MLCVLPFYSGDVEMALRLLAWIIQLGGCRNHDLLLAADAGVDSMELFRVKAMAEVSFKSITVISNEASVKGWPQGPNSLWLAAAGFCNTAGRDWFWMETDCVPTQSNFLDAIEREYAGAVIGMKGAIMGCVYGCDQPGLPVNPVSGIAVYPRDAFAQYGGLVNSNPSVAFDVVISRNCSHPRATQLIHHFWGENNLPPTFIESTQSFPPRNAKTLSFISKDAVIFHRNKDGTLIDLLRKNTGRESVKTCGKVSAVVSVHQPPVDRLNRCLECLTPQVDEILVVTDQSSIYPEGALSNSKIRRIKVFKPDCGFGNKCNSGFENSIHEFVWFVNDDCYPNPFCASALKMAFAPDVGAVTHTLRFPDGRIQFGGKLRIPGQRFWPHEDLGRLKSSHTHPVEQETLCAASVMVRRKVFEQAGGFDTGIKMYLEDDMLGLAIRKLGWRIMFTPHAEAVHLQGASAKLRTDMAQIHQQSRNVFEAKWGWYLDKNKIRVPGVFT